MEARANLGSGSDADAAAGPSGQHQPEGSSKADSLAVLLTQALRSNDRSLLEKCLATSNTKIIANTVRRLLPVDAALFLRAAVDRVLSKPARAVQLAPWIKAIMLYHTGYMMTAPGVQAPLTALYQAIDSRVGLYPQLLKVYGRLSLITAHSAHASSSAAGGEGGEDGEDGMPEPEVVFEDGDDDEPEPEDPFAPLEDDEDEDDEEGDEEADADGDMSEDGSGMYSEEDGDEDDEDDEDDD